MLSVFDTDKCDLLLHVLLIAAYSASCKMALASGIPRASFVIRDSYLRIPVGFLIIEFLIKNS